MTTTPTPSVWSEENPERTRTLCPSGDADPAEPGTSPPERPRAPGGHAAGRPAPGGTGETSTPWLLGWRELLGMNTCPGRRSPESLDSYPTVLCVWPASALLPQLRRQEPELEVKTTKPSHIWHRSVFKNAFNSPMSRLIRTSCPASVLLCTRHTRVPQIHVMPWPVRARRATTVRTLPHEDELWTHTPRRLERQMSMANREFMAIPLKDGLSSMQSSSGSLDGSLRSFAFSGSGGFSHWWVLHWLVLLDALLFRSGWFSDKNSGRPRTLPLRSLALDRLGLRGIVRFSCTVFSVRLMDVFDEVKHKQLVSGI